METYLVFTDYIHHAMKRGDLIDLEDGGVAGQIPEFPGVLAFGKDRDACRHQLQASLEVWLLIALKLGHSIPIVRGINLNQEPVHESY